MQNRAVQGQLQTKNIPFIATSRLDQELVNAHVSVVIQLGALGSLGMVGGSTPLVLSGLALIFLVLIIASKHLLRKGASKERRSTMETKPNVNTNISLSKSVHEALHEFAVSFGAGFLGGTIPSITPLRLTAQRTSTRCSVLSPIRPTTDVQIGCAETARIGLLVAIETIDDTFCGMTDYSYKVSKEFDEMFERLRSNVESRGK